MKENPFISEESFDYLNSLEADLNAIAYEFKELDQERNAICNEIETIQLEFEKLTIE